MPRKGHIAKRDVLPDPIYNSKVVTKLINNVMEDGKNGVAQRICYDAFEIMAQKTGKDALEVFEEAMNNVMPLLEVKARRIGGANYQVPIEVRAERRQTLGIRWLLDASRKRGEKVMAQRLAGELMDAAKKMANGIAMNAPIAVRACKKAINEGLEVGMDDAIVIEEKLFGSCFETEDQKAGMGNFLEKDKEKKLKVVPFANK